MQAFFEFYDEQERNKTNPKNVKYPLKISRVFDTLFATQNDNKTMLQITNSLVEYKRIQDFDFSLKKYFYHTLLQEKDQLNVISIQKIFREYDLNLVLYDAALFHLYLHCLCMQLQTKQTIDLNKIFQNEFPDKLVVKNNNSLFVEVKTFYIKFEQLREILFKEGNTNTKMKEIINRIDTKYRQFINKTHFPSTTKLLLDIDMYKTNSINTSKINDIFKSNNIPLPDQSFFLYLKFIKQENKTLKYLITESEKIKIAQLKIQKSILKTNIVDSNLKINVQNIYQNAQHYAQKVYLQQKRKLYQLLLKYSNTQNSDVLETDLKKLMEECVQLDKDKWDSFMISIKLKKGEYFQDVFFDFCERRVHQKPYKIPTTTICDILFDEKYSEKSLPEIMDEIYNETKKRMDEFNFHKKKKIYDVIFESKNTQNQISMSKINNIWKSFMDDDEKKNDEKKDDGKNQQEFNIFLNLYLQCECNGFEFDVAFKKMLQPKGNEYIIDHQKCFIRFDKLRQTIFAKPDIQQTISKINYESGERMKQKFNEYYEQLDKMKDAELRKKLIFWQKENFFILLQPEMKLTEIYGILKNKLLKKITNELTLVTLQCFYLICSNNINNIAEWIISSFSNQKIFKTIKDSKRFPAIKTKILKQYMTQKCNSEKGILQIIRDTVNYLDEVKFNLAQCLFEEIDEQEIEQKLQDEIYVDAEVICDAYNDVFDNNKIQKKQVLNIDNEDDIFLLTYFIKVFEKKKLFDLFRMNNKHDLRVNAKIFLQTFILQQNLIYDLSLLENEAAQYRTSTFFDAKKEFYLDINSAMDEKSKCIKTMNLYKAFQKLLNKEYSKQEMDEKLSALFIELKTNDTDFYDAFFGFYDEKYESKEKSLDEMNYELKGEPVINYVFDSKNETKNLTETVKQRLEQSVKELEQFDFTKKNEFYVELAKSKPITQKRFIEIFTNFITNQRFQIAADSIFSLCFYLQYKANEIKSKSTDLKQRIMEIMVADKSCNFSLKPFENISELQKLIFTQYQPNSKLTETINELVEQSQNLMETIYDTYFVDIKNEKDSTFREIMIFMQKKQFYEHATSNNVLSIEQINDYCKLLKIFGKVNRELSDAFFVELKMRNTTNFKSSLFELIDSNSYCIDSKLLIELVKNNANISLYEIFEQQEQNAIKFLQEFDFDNKQIFYFQTVENQTESSNIITKLYCDILDSLKILVSNDKIKLVATEEHAFFFVYIKMKSLGFDSSDVDDEESKDIMKEAFDEMFESKQEEKEKENMTINQFIENYELNADFVRALHFEPEQKRDKQPLESIINELYNEAKKIMDKLDFEKMLEEKKKDLLEEAEQKKGKDPDQGKEKLNEDGKPKKEEGGDQKKEEKDTIIERGDIKEIENADFNEAEEEEQQKNDHDTKQEMIGKNKGNDGGKKDDVFENISFKEVTNKQRKKKKKNKNKRKQLQQNEQFALSDEDEDEFDDDYNLSILTKKKLYFD